MATTIPAEDAAEKKAEKKTVLCIIQHHSFRLPHGRAPRARLEGKTQLCAPATQLTRSSQRLLLELLQLALALGHRLRQLLHEARVLRHLRRQLLVLLGELL